MDPTAFDATIRTATSESWNVFLKTVDPLRADLFRYCRRLTGNVWDAEDLVQDTLEQAAVRDAAEHMLSHLAPQEQAAVVLKEVFGMSLDEIAGVLATTSGAVKSALHRGRTRLLQADEATPPRNPVSRSVLERFVQCFNARDRDGMLALMLDGATVRMPGVDYEIGREGFDREPGWLYYNLLNPRARWEVVEFRGEPLVAHLPQGDAGIGSVMRFETEGDYVSAIRVYAFCPDAVSEVAAALDRPGVSMGRYRFDPEMFKHLDRGQNPK